MGLAATTWVPIGAQVPILSPNDHPNSSQGTAGGGDPSVLDANYPPPQLTVGRRPLGGGGGGGWEGRRGGRFPGGGGGSGTSEQLGMRPTCDPTVRTAPSHNRG